MSAQCSLIIATLILLLNMINTRVVWRKTICEWDLSFLLSRMLEKFKNDVEKQQAEQMTDWQTKLVMMDSKERQYILQVSNYKVTSFLFGSFLCNA